MREELYPGQVEALMFSLEQVRSLTSSSRSDVFWTFLADEPLSVSDVAHGLGKSTSSVNYHVHELLRIGLLLDVDSRRRGARTERLYVLSARDFFSGSTADKAYRDEVNRGFNAVTRHLARERALALEVGATVPNSGLYSFFQHANIRLSPEGVREAHRLLQELYRKLIDLEGTEGHHFHLSLHVNPTPQTSREVYKRAYGAEIEEPSAEIDE